MSSQSGGDGYSKVRKACQTGGASGWAKHCGNTDDHKKSNRLERKLGKQDLDDEFPAPRMRTTSKRNKVPSRRHLMDKYSYLKAELDSRQKEKDAHDRVKKPDCKCHMHCWDYKDGFGDWVVRWRSQAIDKLLKEFEKYGYDKP